MTHATLADHITDLNASLRNTKTALRLLTQHTQGRVWLYATPGDIEHATVMTVGQPTTIAQAATEWAKKQSK